MSATWLFLTSMVAGGVGAMSGMGGGIVLIPTLTGCGIDIKRAIAISLLSTIVISSSASPGYVRHHIPNLRICAFLEVFAVLGSLFGASIAVVLGQRPLFFLCGGILLASCTILWRRRQQPWKPGLQHDAVSRWLAFDGNYYDDAEKRTIAYRANRAPLGGLLMFGAGIISGGVGIGGSALTVLIHKVVMGLPPKVSLTMSNLIIGGVALAGASIYLEAGLIDVKLAIPVILGVPVGALIGSKLLIGFTNQTARVIFFCALVVLGVEMIVHGIRGM